MQYTTVNSTEFIYFATIVQKQSGKSEKKMCIKYQQCFIRVVKVVCYSPDFHSRRAEMKTHDFLVVLPERQEFRQTTNISHIASCLLIKLVSTKAESRFYRFQHNKQFQNIINNNSWVYL